VVAVPLVLRVRLRARSARLRVERVVLTDVAGVARLVDPRAVVV
jgi:hypothetical protein